MPIHKFDKVPALNLFTSFYLLMYSIQILWYVFSDFSIGYCVNNYKTYLKQ